LKLAWKNMWRNKTRTFITMSAIFFAVILSVITSSLKTGVFNNLVKNVVGFYSGYIQVHKHGYWNEQILDNSFTQSDNMEQIILAGKGIKTAAPRLESFALASSNDITKGCLVVGVAPSEENKITALKSKITEGRYFSDNDTAVLLSQGLANRLKLWTNDTIVLISQGYHSAMAAGKYKIVGILKFGSPELNEKTLFMPLPVAQDFYGSNGMITSYVLSVTHAENIDKDANTIQLRLGNEYEVMTWEQMMPEISQHIKTDSNNMLVVQGILYLLISFGIFSTLLMLMVERQHEMGMLVAIGMKKSKLAVMLLMESVLTVISGCMLGITASIPIIYYLHTKPIRISGAMAKIYERFGFEAIFPASLQAGIFITQCMIVLFIGFLLSLYPVYKVIRLNPVNAMKK